MAKRTSRRVKPSLGSTARGRRIKRKLTDAACLFAGVVYGAQEAAPSRQAEALRAIDRAEQNLHDAACEWASHILLLTAGVAE